MEYIQLDDRFAAPDGATVINKPRERTFGEAAGDVAGNILSALANGGRGLAVLGAGLEAGLNTEAFQRKQRAIERADRMAEYEEEGKKLANIAAAQGIQHGKNAEKRADESHRNSLLDFGIRAESNKIRLHKAWETASSSRSKQIVDAIKQRGGYANWNFGTQALFDNTQMAETFAEAATISEAYARSQAEGDFLLGTMGYKREKGTSGKEYFVSPEGVKVDVSIDGQKKLYKEMQEKLLADLRAANIAGTDSSDVISYVLKNTINNKEASAAFGPLGGVMTAYQQYLANGNFTAADKVGHLLSRTLQYALDDGKISTEEQKQLMPIFASYVKKMGGEVLWGQTAEDTRVRLGDGSEVKLNQFKEQLKNRDKIAFGWNATVQDAIIKRAVAAKKGAGGNGEENENKNEEALYQADALYGDVFAGADSKKQQEVAEALIKFEASVNEALKREDKGKVSELSLEGLRRLDRRWTQFGLGDKFYSPYQNVIFSRELTELEKEKAPLIKELRELEEKYPDKSKGQYVHSPSPLGMVVRSTPKGYRDAVAKMNALKKKIDSINDSIKMREGKLTERGISLKESK